MQGEITRYLCWAEAPGGWTINLRWRGLGTGIVVGKRGRWMTAVLWSPSDDTLLREPLLDGEMFDRTERGRAIARLEARRYGPLIVHRVTIEGAA